MESNFCGYRGYIGSRAYISGDFPQYLQNLLIRNYCQKYQLAYLLSATEYSMPGCYMILEEVLTSLDAIDGIVLFSIFMLPQARDKRQKIYEKVLQSGRVLHAALEDICVKNADDISMVEDILSLNGITATPELLEEWNI